DTENRNGRPPAAAICSAPRLVAALALRTGFGFGAKVYLQRFNFVDIHVQRPPRRKRGRVLLRPAVVVLGPQHAAHVDADRKCVARQLVFGSVQRADLAGAEEYEVIAVEELRVDLQPPLQGPQFGGLRPVARSRPAEDSGPDRHGPRRGRPHRRTTTHLLPSSPSFTRSWLSGRELAPQRQTMYIRTAK